MPFMPVRALGAPHTTWTVVPLPVSTLQTRSLDHVAHDEALQGRGGIGHALDLEAEHGERVTHLDQRGVGLEMLLEPGQGELHRPSPPVSEGVSRAEKP
jgi:hypothetical protein